MQKLPKSSGLQRWDDHRYYHHSRINQTLHLVSAISFLCAYALAFTDPAAGGDDRLAGGDDHAPGRPLLLRAEGLRPHQPGDPRAQGRDQGRLQSAPQGRADDDLGAVAGRGLSQSDAVRPLGAAQDRDGIHPARRAALAVLGIGGLLFRTVHLFFIQSVQTGLVWATKILTDPFHDIKLYCKAPLALLRGELIDPRHAQHARRRRIARATRRAELTRRSAGRAERGRLFAT